MYHFAAQGVVLAVSAVLWFAGALTLTAFAAVVCLGLLTYLAFD